MWASGGNLMSDYLWIGTQIAVIIASVCNILSWATMAFAMRLYAPYPREKVK